MFHPHPPCVPSCILQVGSTHAMEDIKARCVGLESSMATAKEEARHSIKHAEKQAALLASAQDGFKVSRSLCRKLVLTGTSACLDQRCLSKSSGNSIMPVLTLHMMINHHLLVGGYADQGIYQVGPTSSLWRTCSYLNSSLPVLTLNQNRAQI